MIEFIGWAASACFFLSGVPFAWRAIREGNVDMPWTGILLILAGSAGMLAYESGTARSIPQIVDFGVTTTCWLTVALIKLQQQTSKRGVA